MKQNNHMQFHDWPADLQLAYHIARLPDNLKGPPFGNI